MTTTHVTKIVVLGGGYGGMAAALRLANNLKRLPVQITLINGSDTFVERIRLHQIATAQRVRHRSILQLLRGTGITFLKGWVTNLLPQRQQVVVNTEQGEQALPYDYLMLGLGSITDKDSIVGVRENSLSVGDPLDAALLEKRLPHLRQSSKVVVVGGGLTGIETATEIAEAYPKLAVHVVTAGTVGAGLSQRGREHIRRVFGRLGITLHENMTVRQVEASAVIATDGSEISFDLCIWAGSFRGTALAANSGLATNAKGQILIDRFMRSVDYGNIYAFGDTAAFVDNIGITIRMACATAIPMSIHAADNLYKHLIDQKPEPFHFGYVLQCISLGRKNGLIQFVGSDDVPRESVLTGKVAAFVKEAVCQYARVSSTVGWAIRSYRWPKQHGAPNDAELAQSQTHIALKS
ncbi:MAG: FAD-dependent oxidoreductase [Anaerolineae bacterium]